MPDAIIKPDSFTFSPYFPYQTLLHPMNTAKPQGPSRSPTVLLTPREDSANADAHCAMDASEAPALIIRTMKSQKTFVFMSCPIVMPAPSFTMGSMGQKAKLMMLNRGITDHKQARIRQCSVPKTAKNRVEPRIVPTAPQL